MDHRTILFISDQTGVTAETLGHSLLTQFDGVDFRQVTVPFIDSPDKAREAVERINLAGREEQCRPIVFSTLVQEDLRRIVQQSEGLFLDFFDAFVAPLEKELGRESTHKSGRAHGMSDLRTYTQRIEATNFALANDDGAITHDYSMSDVILIGVSRSGKTPTCLYLALQYGVYAANYPLTDEDLEAANVPKELDRYRDKLYGLTIAPERLQQIRKERRPMGRYATAQQVNFELRAAEAIFNRHGIPFVNTTEFSIEEIASTILNNTGVERRVRP